MLLLFSNRPNDSPLLLLFIPSSGGAPFNDPSPLLPRDGAPLRDDSPPADLEAENKKQLSVLGHSFRYVHVVNKPYQIPRG